MNKKVKYILAQGGLDFHVRSDNLLRFAKKSNFNEHEFWAKVQEVADVGDFRKLFHVFATIESCQGRIVTCNALNVNYLFQGFLCQFFVDINLASVL